MQIWLGNIPLYAFYLFSNSDNTKWHKCENSHDVIYDIKNEEHFTLSFSFCYHFLQLISGNRMAFQCTTPSKWQFNMDTDKKSLSHGK